MATLKTQGFALSSLPRAPDVPKNIGVVDVQAIDQGVRERLKTFELARQLPRSMALADTQMDAEIARAPLQTRQVLAQTEGIEAQTPLRTALLAAEASPEFQDAKRQAMLAKTAPRQPSGDVQLASALATAQLRLAEDPNDAQAAALVATLGPMALKKSAVSAADPQGAIQAGIQRTDSTNATRESIAGAANTTRTNIADANRSAADMRSEAQRGQSQTNAQIAADSRVNAARAAFSGKIYETAAQKNEKVQTDLLALKALDQKVDALKNSALGSGVIVGSGPAVAIRSIFGDNAGKELAAATALSMGSAVETMRGLGAMSEREFQAAMSQLPLASDPEPALITKMEYLNSVRPWIAARNAAFLERLEAGDSPMKAHEFVRRSLPLILPNGQPLAESVTPTATFTPTPVPAPSRFQIIEVR